MKKRVTMQVSVNFDNLIKDIQKEFMKRGEKRSTVDITEILRKKNLKNLILDKAEELELNFDRRLK